MMSDQILSLSLPPDRLHKHLTVHLGSWGFWDTLRRKNKTEKQTRGRESVCFHEWVSGGCITPSPATSRAGPCQLDLKWSCSEATARSCGSININAQGNAIEPRNVIGFICRLIHIPIYANRVHFSLSWSSRVFLSALEKLHAAAQCFTISFWGLTTLNNCWCSFEKPKWEKNVSKCVNKHYEAYFFAFQFSDFTSFYTSCGVVMKSLHPGLNRMNPGSSLWLTPLLSLTNENTTT